MNVKDVCRVLGEIAPLSLAAEWDNVGLLLGDPKAVASKLLLCIDLTEDVLAEAARSKATMVMAYHPVIFKGVTRITTESTPVLYAAAKRGLAVYSMHTALDAAVGGTNDVLADMLGLVARRPLQAVGADACKVVVFVPADDLSAVAAAAFAAGAGRIGDYHECSFFSHGIGTFHGSQDTHPARGQAGRHEAVEEIRLEILAPRAGVLAVCDAIRAVHSYEKPALDVYPLLAPPGTTGMGRVGRLGRPTKLATIIRKVKKSLGLSRVQLAGPDHGGAERMIGTAAVAAGSAGSMWRSAVSAGASLYLTGEMRHHDALAAAAAGLHVIGVGHSHSERLTLGRLAERLTSVAPKLKVILSREDRDPLEIV
jgi:dinuclear metal center YbgI/SA1388 family protein